VTEAPREWWRRHRATVVLVGVALTVGLSLGLTAPATSPVNEVQPPSAGTGP
jgi:hypothetical protein